MKKGSFGYIDYKKKQSAVLAAVMLALILAVYFIALSYFKTNQNFFSIAAALLCLPEGKLVINMIMFLRAKGCSRDLQERIRKTAVGGGGMYDLYLTSYSKNYQISHLFAEGSSVIAVTEDPQCDVKEGEQHIRRMMQSNGIHGVSVKIFRDPGQYLARLDELAGRQRGEDPEMTTGTQEKIAALLKAISL